MKRMNSLTLVNKNGTFYADSREVAEMVDKRHGNLVRDIDGYIEILNGNQTSDLSSDNFFVESGYTAGTGKYYKMYLITRRGCDMVANKMTGEKGVLFTASYVTRFEEMERQLATPFKIPQTLSEALRLAADLEEERQRLLPKAEYFDALVERNLLTNFRDTAKEIGIEERKMVKQLEEKHYIYRDTKGRIKPYAQHVPDLFQIKEYRNPKTEHVGNQTLITPKGRETFRLLLKAI